MTKTILFLSTIFLLAGCMPGGSKLSVDMKKKLEKENFSASVSSVQIINNQLVINGAGLSGVSSVKVNGTSLNENFTIESLTPTKIIANSIHAFSFDVSKVFSLVLSDADASATFQIDFSLCNSTLNGAGFDCTASIADNDVLTYDSSTNKWIPRPLSGLSYKGVWDANTALPSSNLAGQYYIISVANLPTYSVGDWIVWNGSSYDVVAQSTAGGVSTVFGRSGAVVALEGDYNLNKLLDVDLSVAPTSGQVLKYDGAKWIADDEAGGALSAGSITATELASNSVTDAKIVGISASKITGAITSAQITDGAIVNADINAAAAIDYSKLNIPAASIPYAKLLIADGDIPAAKITGLPTVASVLATAATDGDTTHAPDGNTVFDLFAALSTTGVTEGTRLYFTNARAIAAPITGLSSASGTIAATDTILGAFGKLLGTQGDYVSKSANTTVLGKITIDNTVGELHVPTLPTTGGDLTQAANAGYVENYVTSVIGALGQWIKTGANIGYTAGNVGVGVANPGAKFHVMNGATAFEKTTADGSGPTFSFWKHRNYAATVSGDELGFISFFGHDGTGLARSAFILGKTDGAPSAGSVPGSLSFFTTTAGSADSTEKMHISANGNVGIGKSSPDHALDVVGDIVADALLIRGEVGTFGWNGDVYSSSSITSGTPDGTGVRVTNANDMDGALSFFTGASRNDAGTTQTYYIGSVSNTAGYAPTIVFGQQSGATAYNERMRISASGNVGIGTTNPQATLTVGGAIVSTPPAPYAGAAVNLATSNTQVLTNVGGTAITLSNMVHGGSYTLIIQDTTSRQYTFTGCATSKFQPANMATIALTHSIYNIMTVYNGTNYDCYITWSSGYN